MVERWTYARRQPWVLAPITNASLAFALPAAVNAARCRCLIGKQESDSAERPTQTVEVWMHVSIQRRRFVSDPPTTAGEADGGDCRASIEKACVDLTSLSGLDELERMQRCHTDE